MRRLKPLPIPPVVGLTLLILIASQLAFSLGSRGSSTARVFSQSNASWSTPIPISDDPGSGDSPDNPDVAVCADGTVHVVWEQDGKIWHNYRPPDGGWHGPAVATTTVLSSTIELEGTDPSIAAGPGCVVHLAWTKDWGRFSNIFYSKWDGEALQWLGQQNASRTYDSQSLHPDIAVTSTGESRIVWAEGGVSPSLYWGQPEDRGSKPILELLSDEFRDDFPSLTFDADDRAHLVWQRQKGITETIDIYYTRQEALDRWTPWRQDISSSSHKSSRPQITMVGNRPLVAWLEKIGDRRETFASQSDDSWNWQVPISLSGNRDVKPDPPALTAGDTGPVHVAWAEKNPVDAIAYAMLWPLGGRLRLEPISDPVMVSNGGENVRRPAIATSQDNTRVYLVWVEDSEGSTRVYFSETHSLVHNFYISLIARQHGK